MATELYDVIVVGAGIVGSATAYHLARSRKKVLLLEQFAVPHSRGSSHGQTRIIRRIYAEQHYADMMNEAYDQWRQLELEADTTLIKETGGLLVCPPKYYSALDSTQAALVKTNSPHEMLTSSQLKERFPHLQFGEEYRAVYDSGAGTIKAERALMAYQMLFKKHGGVFMDDTKVTKITPGDTVTIETNSGDRIHGQRLIITAGSWAGPIVEGLGIQLPLKPTRINVCFWKGVTPGILDIDAPFPVIIVMEPEGHFYGLPADEYPECAKICLHTGPEVDPDYRDFNQEQWDQDILTSFVKRHFPCCETTPAVQERCLYTVTPDEEFIVDVHPRYDNIVIGAGFSGHGFKMAPVVGRILGQLAYGEKPDYNISPLRIGRFKQHVKSNI